MTVFDNGLNPRHVDLMVDLMTYRGGLMQIDRHGINKKDDSGPISKASFEEIMNVFVKAAVFGEKDNMKGASANMFVGQFCKSGTNAFDVLLDTDSIINSELENTYSEYLDVEKDELETEDLDSFITQEFSKNKDVTEDDFKFGIDLPNISGQKVEKVELPDIDIEITKNNNVVKNITIEGDLDNMDIDEDSDIENEEQDSDEENEEDSDEENSDDVFGDDEFEDLESDEEEPEESDEEEQEESDEEEPEESDEEEPEESDEEEPEESDEEDTE
jgi:hypothetical protein